MKFISRLEQDIALVRCAHSWDILFTLEINFIFPRNHVIFSISSMIALNYCSWPLKNMFVCHCTLRKLVKSRQEKISPVSFPVSQHKIIQRGLLKLFHYFLDPTCYFWMVCLISLCYVIMKNVFSWFFTPWKKAAGMLRFILWDWFLPYYICCHLEPTNMLDLNAIIWLENYLQVLMIPLSTNCFSVV